MKRSVGLVLLARILEGEGRYRIVVVLQKRGTYNWEKMELESYPGCLQVTCHGKLNGGEDFHEAILREMKEELRLDFSDLLVGGYPGQVLVHSQTTEKEVVTFGAVVPVIIINNDVRLEPGSGGLIPLERDQVGNLVAITPDMKVNGPPPGVLAMFPDEIVAVKKAFEIFGTT